MVTPVEASERLIGLVRENDDIANHGDGCDADTIAEAEDRLGALLPPSYRRLVEEFGTWDLAGEEFLGVYRTAAMGEKLLGSVAETEEARAGYGMPTGLIAVMFDGMGGLVVLDAAKASQDGEYPVSVWGPGSPGRDDLERLGDDFGTFALLWCERAVARWRESA